jgi:DNA-binding response OmpR family regulator
MKDLPAAGKSILVVEDEPTICDVCMRVLAGEGHDVDVAADGLVAKGMLAKKDYDLCLVDIRTPVMNGKELYQHIINNNPEMADRVIFTTGDLVDGYTQRFLEMTGRPYLTKPFTPDELRAIVKEALQ